MAVQTYKNGKFVDGKAAPRLLREDLRALPSEWLTNDIEKDDAIHEDDPDHVIAAITDDKLKELAAEAAPEKPKKAKRFKAPPIGRKVKISAMFNKQMQVDIVRIRVLAVVLDNQLALCKAGLDLDMKPRHLWFPNDNINEYEMRRGNAPSNTDRPKWLRNLDLSIDIFEPPKRISDLAAEMGAPLWSLSETLERERADDERIITI